MRLLEEERIRTVEQINKEINELESDHVQK